MKKLNGIEALKSWKWWDAALTRAIKTMAQTFVAMLGTSTLIESVDWRVVMSATVLSGVASLATSLAGLPEIEG